MYISAAVKNMYQGKKTLLTQYSADGKIENKEMVGACGAYVRGERFAQGSGGET
jgi:hypothetical protein